jgi:hypothetical protein
VDFISQNGFGDSLSAITDFLGFFAADGPAGEKAFYDFLGMAHNELKGQGRQTTEGQSLSSLGEPGIIGGYNDIRTLYNIQTGFNGPAMNLADDNLIAIQDSLGESKQMVLINLESDSLGGFIGWTSAVDSVNHGEIKSGTKVLAGASYYDYVAIIIMISSFEGFDQVTGHLVGTNADGIVLIGTVQGDINHLGIHFIMFVPDPFEIGWGTYFGPDYLLIRSFLNSHYFPSY